MSEPVSALAGASFQGFATVTEAGPSGVISLRSDLGATKLKSAIKAATGVAVPGVRAVAFAGDTGVAWMSPDELLILCAYGNAPTLLVKLQKALKGLHHLVANVSDARARISVTGVDAREVLAKLTPADVSPAAFGPGSLRRSRLGQVPAAFWVVDDMIEVICFRSVAQYVFDILKSAARLGSEVRYFGE